MKRAARNPRGFSLIEVMVVVAIVGVLTSVALPTFERMNVRSKTSERPLVMNAILRGIEDIYRRNGSAVFSHGDANPPSPGPSKQVLNASLTADWTQLLNAVQVEGSVYYSYSFQAWEGAEPGAWITATGDLDGDGAPSTVTLACPRDNGVYKCTQCPGPACSLPGFPPVEDATTF